MGRPGGKALQHLQPLNRVAEVHFADWPAYHLPVDQPLLIKERRLKKVPYHGAEGPVQPAATPGPNLLLSPEFNGSNLPSVISTGVGGRNVLRIKMPSKAPTPMEKPSDSLEFLAGVADGMVTPQVAATQLKAAAGEQQQPVVLLSKALVRVSGTGRPLDVQGAI